MKPLLTVKTTMGFKILLLFLKKEVNRKEKDNSSGHI
jgi:hypothetical protein